MPQANWGDLATLPPNPSVATRGLRTVSAELMKIVGVPVTINDTFRTGALMLEPEHQRITCSAATLSWLESAEVNGGDTWRKVAGVLHAAVEEAGARMKSQMVDVGAKVGLRVVDRRRTTRPSNDRLDFVCQGISDLVAQMAPFCDGRELTGNQVGNFVKRYGELRDQMAILRKSMDDAEGRFELAQAQVVKLMEGQE